MPSITGERDGWMDAEKGLHEVFGNHITSL